MSHDDSNIDVTRAIIDFVAMCEKFGPLDFELFVEMWKDADAIARASQAIGPNSDALPLDLLIRESLRQLAR